MYPLRSPYFYDEYDQPNHKVVRIDVRIQSTEAPVDVQLCSVNAPA